MTIQEEFSKRLAEAKRHAPFGYIPPDSLLGLQTRVARNHGVTVTEVIEAIRNEHVHA